MKNSRAYSFLTVKSVDDERRIIEGIASTPSPDRMQDIVDLAGMSFALPLPFLYQHNSRQPIGKVISAEKKKDGLHIRAQIAGDIAPYIPEAWALIKGGWIPGLSIGFRSIEESFNKETGGLHFKKTEIYEISAVTIPANAECTIQNIKSADAALLALSGTKPRVVRLDSTANPSAVAVLSGKKDMTTKERITSFENKRAASIARMEAIMGKADDEGRTMDDTEAQEYDGLKSEVDSIDTDLVRARAHEKMLAATATSVTVTNSSSTELASETRGGNNRTSVVTVNSLVPKGIGFARACIAMMACRGNRTDAVEAVRKYYPDMSGELETIIKAEQLPGTTTGTTWAAPLIQSSGRLIGEFIELLRAATLINKIPGLRRVPFNVTVPLQTGGGTYQWVGENQPKPVSGLALGTVVLRWAKIAGIIPFTKEAMKFSDPSIEAMVRDDMVAGLAAYMDTQFIDPAVHESANVSPASITDQIVNTAASGTTAAAFRADFNNILSKMIANNQDPANLVALSSSTIAMNLASKMNATTSLPEFPSIGITGGSYLGIPIIVSSAVGARIILLNPSRILIAEDPGITIDVSEEASVVMTTTPASSPAATSLVSFWQNNLIGVRLDHFVTWKRATTADVEYISGAAYTG